MSRIFIKVKEDRPGVHFIGVNVDYFATVTKICKALGKKSNIVKITFQDVTSAMFIDIDSPNGDAQYCVMPARV
ncbi:hypothetical protein D3C80_1691940 [compost metagenome]